MSRLSKARVVLCALILFVPAWATASESLSPPGYASGAYYPWQKTMRPERPWLHDYSQTLVMKIFLCSRDSKGDLDKVYLKFDQALEVIKKLDNLTLGIPKIVYLVGWQFNGHDSGYPSWSVVNEHLKHPQDQTALQSLKWLMQEAKKYRTTVSLHINMIDAYASSPLWKTYDEANVILKDKSAQPIKGEVFDGLQSYQISYAQEWEAGLAQKRIDGLLQMLPELRQAGTIHIDAFHSIQPARPHATISNPYVGTTVNEEIAAQRKIFRYWRTQGLDVTAEADIYELRKDPFIGLQPMAWHFSIDRFRQFHWLGKPADFKTLPPSLYIGTPMQAEEEIRHDPEHLSGLLRQFCTQVVPWYYRNHMQGKKDSTAAMSSSDIFLPALWLPSTIVAYSDKGYADRKITLPQRWKDSHSVKLMQITTDGLKAIGSLPVEGNAIRLTVKGGEGIAIQGCSGEHHHQETKLHIIPVKRGFYHKQ